jgi:hypothetical protein
LNGYLNPTPDERFLILQMQELLTYLGQQGVLTILVLAQHGPVGPMDTSLDISYLSDAVLMLRYFELSGDSKTRLCKGTAFPGRACDTRRYRRGDRDRQALDRWRVLPAARPVAAASR